MMMGQDRKGQLPTPEELFDHVLLIADLCEKSLMAGEAVRDESIRASKNLTHLHGEYQNEINSLTVRVEKQRLELHNLYAPDIVRKAAKEALEIVSDSKGSMNKIIQDLTESLQDTTDAIWIRFFGFTLIGIAILFIFLCTAARFIPSLDEINSRRADLQAINQQIERQASTLERRRREK
jgi:hypothetical protein